MPRLFCRIPQTLIAYLPLLEIGLGLLETAGESPPPLQASRASRRPSVHPDVIARLDRIAATNRASRNAVIVAALQKASRANIAPPQES